MKKVIFSVLTIICLVGLVGCGLVGEPTNNNGNKIKRDSVTFKIDGEEFELYSTEDFKDIHYKENYTEFHTDAFGNIRTMTYFIKGETIFSLRVACDEEHTLQENIDSLGHETTKKTIKDIEYDYADFVNDEGNTVHVYLKRFNNKNYTIAIISKKDKDLTEFEKAFMESVYFKNEEVK